MSIACQLESIVSLLLWFPHLSCLFVVSAVHSRCRVVCYQLLAILCIS